MRFGLNWRGPWIKYRACSISAWNRAPTIFSFEWWRSYVSHYIFICATPFGSCFSLLLHERDKYLLKERDFILHGNESCYNFHIWFILLFYVFFFFFNFNLVRMNQSFVWMNEEEYLKKKVKIKSHFKVKLRSVESQSGLTWKLKWRIDKRSHK